MMNGIVNFALKRPTIIVILTVTTVASLWGDRRDRQSAAGRPPAPASR